MRTYALSLSWALLWAIPVFAAPPVMMQDFEQDTAGWLVVGGEGKLQVTHDSSLVKNGHGAMEFRYEASGAKPAILVLPASRPLAAMKSLNTWMMSDADTVVALALMEKNGGHYVAPFWLEANTWQRVELTPDDFQLSTNPNDPKDPDGKLDLDQIETMAIIDVSQLFGAMGLNNHAPILVQDFSGPHKLWVDDFEISPDAPAWAAAKTRFLIEDFRAPQINWFSMGGASLKVDSSGSVIKGRAVQMDCNQLADRFVIVMHPLAAMDLTGATHIVFDIAAEKPAHLVLSLEEKSDQTEGPRYNLDFEVPGGNQVSHRELALAAFDPDDNGSKDADHKLDLDKLKSLGLVNVTGAYTGEDSVNTIRIGKIEAVKAK
jgi:hypothetical protein